MFLGLSPIRLKTYWVMGLYPGPLPHRNSWELWMFISHQHGPRHQNHPPSGQPNPAAWSKRQNSPWWPWDEGGEGWSKQRWRVWSWPNFPRKSIVFSLTESQKTWAFLKKMSNLIKLGFFREKTTPSSRFPGFCVESHPRSPTDHIFSPLASSKVQLFCETTGQSGEKVWPMGSSTTWSWKISYRSTPLWAILTRGLANMVLTLW